MRPILSMYMKYDELNNLFREITGFEMWGLKGYGLGGLYGERVLQ